MPLTELKEITNNQKTVSTSRLQGIASQLERLHRKHEQKVNRQSKALERLNKRYQIEKEKADRRKRAMEDYENLKRHHRNLEREYNILLEKVGRDG